MVICRFRSVFLSSTYSFLSTLGLFRCVFRYERFRVAAFESSAAAAAVVAVAAAAATSNNVAVVSPISAPTSTLL